MLYDTKAALGLPGLDPALPGYPGAGPWTLGLKRAFDVAAAIGLLAASLPLLLAAAVLIKLEDNGPVLFRQARVGLRGRVFTLYKLRTMAVDAEALQDRLDAANEMDGPVFKIADDPRVTRIGRVLRRFNIDELPQLVNVLLGQASLVGPRPMSVRDVVRFGAAWTTDMPWALRRFAVKPGLTCLWQIARDRHALPFREWMALDLQYIERRTFPGDIWICLRTLPACLARPGRRILEAPRPGPCRQCA